MSKPSKLALALLLVVPFLAGCPSMQPPSAGDTKTGANGGLVSPTDAGADNTGLTPQGPGDIPADLMDMIKNRTVPPEDILCTVYFDFDQYNVRSDQRAGLEAAAKTLSSDSGQKVVAVGYTDWYGSEQYDLALGDRRANGVKTFATKLGAGDAQIETLSMGKLNAPTNVGKQSSEAQKSRRVDLVKLPAGGNASSAVASGAASAAATPAPVGQ
jgi:peptidoglycan-associated lipoprotein